MHVRLGPPLSGQRYPQRPADEDRVATGRAGSVGDDDVSGYLVNDEIDEVAWVAVDKAAALLTYAHDRETLAEARKRARKTRALVVLRHASARSRKAWRRAGRPAPAAAARPGELQAAAPGARCWRRTTSPGSSRRAAPAASQTVRPVRRHDRLEAARSEDGLSEEDATAEAVVRVVDELLDTRARERCCARTGRCCPRCSTRSASRSSTWSPGACSWRTTARARSIATEHHHAPDVKGRTGCSRDGRLRGEILWTTGRFEFTPRSPTPTHRVTCRSLRSLMSDTTRHQENEVKSTSIRRAIVPGIAALALALCRVRWRQRRGRR